MIPLRSIVKAAPAVSRMAITKRTSVISGPPKNKLSGVEKAGHALFMVLGICAYPAWVLVHIKDYQQK